MIRLGTQHAAPTAPAVVVTGAGACGAFGAGLDRLLHADPRPVRLPVAGGTLPVGLWDGEFRSVWPDAPDRFGRMDRACRMALLAAREAVVGAGLGTGDLASAGVVVGSRFGCLATNGAWHADLWERGARLAAPLLFGYTVASAPAGEISVAYGARGPNLTISAGDASSAAALREAARLIASGRAPRVLAGGYEAISPSVAQELHDRGWRGRRGGAFPAEAAAFVVLEREDLALARGVPSAPVLGIELSFDPDGGEPARPTSPGAHAGGWTFGASTVLEWARAFREGKAVDARIAGGPHGVRATLGAVRELAGASAPVGRAAGGARG